LYLRNNGISGPKREHVLAYKEHLKQTCRPVTIQIYITAVRLFFRWLSSREMYADIADHIKSVKVDRMHKRGYLTTEQVKLVLSRIDRHLKAKEIMRYF
jgi:integrase/recombinase XerC